jgi:hypothetical protein
MTSFSLPTEAEVSTPAGVLAFYLTHKNEGHDVVVRRLIFEQFNPDGLRGKALCRTCHYLVRTTETTHTLVKKFEEAS